LFNQTKFAENIEDKKVGLKTVKPKFTENKYDYSKRHFDEQCGVEILPEIYRIKTFFPDGNTRTFKEFPFEFELGAKQRVPNLTLQRNGMPIRAPGDKFYKNPEHLFNFYKEGGLIPGSTNTINNKRTVSTKSYNYYETLDLNVKTLDDNKIWSNKLKNEIKNYDETYVKTLSNWEDMVLKEYLPKVTGKEKEVKGENAQQNAKGNNKNNKIKK
jgi:hypothetical protein